MTAAAQRHRRSYRRARSRALPVILLLLVVVAAYGAWVVTSLLGAREQIEAGLDAAAEARDGLDAADLTDAGPIELIAEAGGHFRAAAATTGNPAMLPARLVPVLGRQLRSVHGLASSAAEVSDVAVDLHGVALDELDGAAGSGGEARVALLRSLSAAAWRAEARLARLDLGPDDGLIEPLAEARADLAEAVDEARLGLQRGSSGADAAADLLSGPGRYLVVAANNAEMRAGAGMFLSMGVLHAEAGSLTMAEPMRSVLDVEVPEELVPVTGDLADRWGWLRIGSDPRHLMTSPDFPASAEVAARMWAASTGQPVDGVLSFDPVVLQAILAATGPVEVNGRQLDAGNVVGEMLREQYVRFADDVGPGERRDELGVVVATVLARFESGQWDPAVLVRELSGAVRGRHLLAWSSQPRLAEGFRAAGVDGSTGHDTLMVSVLNFGGNKLDQFLEVDSDLALTPGPDGTEAALTVRLRNLTPEAGLPTYVVGPHPATDLAPGEYLGFLSLTLPRASTDARFDDGRPLVAAGPDGRAKVLAAEVRVPRGGEQVLTARFRLPEQRGSLEVAPSARVPATTWHVGGRTWTDTTARAVNW